MQLAQWQNSDAVGLCAALSEEERCPVELRLCPLDVAADSFSELCSALSSSRHVQGLAVQLLSADRPRLNAVRNMLKKNKSLKRVTLTSNDSNPDSSAQVSLGLCSNRNVTDLTLNFCHIRTSAGSLLFRLLAANKALNKMSITCNFEPPPGCLSALGRGLLRNGRIVDFSVVRWKDNECWHPTIGMAVQRNVSRLHRAVWFVLKPNLERSHAEVFENFETKACLLSRLMSATGMTEEEAQAAVRSAQRFIRRHFFTITGLCHHTLQCFAGDGTQIDSLNFECLLAIAKHLKVSDVRAK